LPPEPEAKSDEYTEEMQARMGTALTYRHEDGINYNYVLPDLIVGSCLQGPEDVDRLQAAGVTTVFSLQVRQGTARGTASSSPTKIHAKDTPVVAVMLIN
jgi:hypothetical protein